MSLFRFDDKKPLISNENVNNFSDLILYISILMTLEIKHTSTTLQNRMYKSTKQYYKSKIYYKTHKK